MPRSSGSGSSSGANRRSGAPERRARKQPLPPPPEKVYRVHPQSGRLIQVQAPTSSTPLPSSSASSPPASPEMRRRKRTSFNSPSGSSAGSPTPHSSSSFSSPSSSSASAGGASASSANASSEPSTSRLRFGDNKPLCLQYRLPGVPTANGGAGITMGSGGTAAALRHFHHPFQMKRSEPALFAVLAATIYRLLLWFAATLQAQLVELFVRDGNSYAAQRRPTVIVNFEDYLPSLSPTAPFRMRRIGPPRKRRRRRGIWLGYHRSLAPPFAEWTLL